jgi:hypothetical protein
MFEHRGPSDSLLRPASSREVLAAMLGALRDAHWSAAVGCQPEPGLMLPISIATALGDRTIVANVIGVDCSSEPDGCAQIAQDVCQATANMRFRMERSVNLSGNGA